MASPRSRSSTCNSSCYHVAHGVASRIRVNACANIRTTKPSTTPSTHSPVTTTWRPDLTRKIPKQTARYARGNRARIMLKIVGDACTLLAAHTTVWYTTISHDCIVPRLLASCALGDALARVNRDLSRRPATSVVCAPPTAAATRAKTVQVT